MNFRMTAVLAMAFLLPGCSTPAPEPVAQVPPPAFSRELPLEEPAKPVFRACQLGKSCMAMDARPFEMCLVGGKQTRCIDKAKPLETQVPATPDDTGVVETAARE